MIESIKSLLRPIKWRMESGTDYRTCPICNVSSREFLKFGLIPRADARCPCCGSLERHRLLWLYLQRKTDILKSPPKRALHVAPERILEELFRPLIGKGYLTADLFDPVADVKMDVTDIGYPDNSFDFIYCSHVLEHVPDDRKAMREFHRVLTSDGLAILLVPITTEKTVEDPSIEDPKERLRLFGQEDHVRRYGPDYMGRLVEADFKVEKVERENFLTPKDIRRMGITAASGELFLCRK